MAEAQYLKNELYDLIKNDDTIFDFIQSFALDGMWYWDLEHPKHEWMNAKFWITLGYDPADMPHCADAWQDIIFPEDYDQALQQMQAHFANPDVPYNQVARYRHKDGSAVWIRSRGLAIRDDDGTPIRMLGAHIDVTEDRKAEHRAAEEATLYKTFHENQSTYLIKLDPAGNYTYINDFYCNDFGWLREELMGQSSLIGMVEDDHQKALEVGLACYAEPNKRFKARLRKALKGGTIKVTDWEFTALANAQGEPSELICIGVDVTKQVEAEADLKRQNTLLEDAQRIANMGAWQLDVATDTMTLTDQVYAILELPVGVPIDRAQAIAFYHSDDQPDVLNALEQATEQHLPQDIACRLMTAQGNQRWVYVSVQPVVENGQVVRLIGMFQDITKQKEAELALRESEAKFRSLVENATDLIMLLTPQGEYLYISPKGREIKGFDTKRLIGASYDSFVHPDDIEAIHHVIDTIVSKQTTYEGLVYRAKHGDGTWHWFSANLAPMIDDTNNDASNNANNVTGILVITRDIHQDKVAEQALKTTLTRLEQSNQQNTMLMKEIHHRVKNNLAVISALLSLRARGLKDPSAKDALQESRDRIKVMAEVHELMYQHDSNERIAFDRYLSGLVERMQRSFGYGKQQIRFALEVGQVELGIDQAVPLGLIINELLTNTVKHAFAADHPDPNVTITAVVDDQLTITIIDNGAGMADTTTLETSDSLGMTVINSLTEQLEGQITFESHPRADVGLHVTLRVPLSS